LLRRALRLQEEALGLDDLLVARTRDYLGRNAFNAGRFGEAEGLFRDAARIAVPRTGERTADVAYYFGSIAASLREQGRYGEAWPFVCRSLDIRRELQQGDTLIASSLDNMARIALGEGHAAEARSLHWIYLAAVGPNAPLVRNQAALLDQLRKLAPDAPRVDARDFCNTSRRNC
jgi:tetratricopeptide (TPR) repeat protein